MTKFELKEKAVAIFQSALNAAGFQRYSGSDSEKPKYWRGFVSKRGTMAPIFLRFDVIDNLETEGCDNQSFRRTIYISGELYTRNGFADGEYQDFAAAIERECKKLNITFNFINESYNTSEDQDNAIYYCNFESEQSLILT